MGLINAQKMEHIKGVNHP